MFRKLFSHAVEIVLWLGVTLAVLYVVTYQTDPFPTDMAAVAALCLAGYWTMRTITAQHQAMTERKQIADEAREITYQKERALAFLELARDGIMVLDKDNNIIRINDAITEITGYTKDEVLGQHCPTVFRVEKYKEVGLCFGLAFLNEQHPSYYEEVTVLSKEGQPIDVGVRCAKAVHHPGHRGKHLILIRDLSKIHQAESMEHDFVSMTSHQLFTPLSIIRGHLSLLQDEDLGKINEKQREFIDQSLESVKKMVQLVTDLLSISRLEERKITMNFVPTDIGTVIAGVVKELHPLADHKQITLTFEKPKSPLPTLVIDGEKIGQVLQKATTE